MIVYKNQCSGASRSLIGLYYLKVTDRHFHRHKYNIGRIIGFLLCTVYMALSYVWESQGGGMSAFCHCCHVWLRRRNGIKGVDSYLCPKLL